MESLLVETPRERGVKGKGKGRERQSREALSGQDNTVKHKKRRIKKKREREKK